jgi:hypothetical protein
MKDSDTHGFVILAVPHHFFQYFLISPAREPLLSDGLPAYIINLL